MNEKEDVLQRTAKEYFSSAEDELKKGRNNSAVVLFFKSILSLVDLYILNKKGITPSSHIERFRICRNNLPKIYDILDKDFPFYQDSYIQVMSRELAEVMREDAQIMAKKVGIELL